MHKLPMVRLLQLSTLLALGANTGPAAAHHSFAPHFDAEKPVALYGEITAFEQRNPHAYLHLRVEEADGRVREYVCESHGVTQLTRNGISPDMLRPGSFVGISGSEHRRDPQQCFFDTVYLEDGRELDVNGARGRNTQEPVARRDSIFGTWMIVPAGRATSGPQFMMDYLSPEGRAAVAVYDPFRDDPTYRCEPVAVRRAWFAPGTPMAIQADGDDIIIRHEWMDVERRIHMDLGKVPEDTPASILGFSIGRFEEDVLVIDTTHYTAGVLSQFVDVPGEPTRGLLRSDQLRTVERIRFLPASNRIHLTIEHEDPLFYTRAFPEATAEFAASNLDIMPFGCIPQQLK